jgi:Uma2 family endonuclease
VFFTKARRHLVELRAPIRHAPDLAVEVLSASTRVMDRGRKMQMLGRYRVPEYCLADPDTRELEIYTLEEDGYRLAQRAAGTDVARSVLLQHLAFTPASLFPEPRPGR